MIQILEDLRVIKDEDLAEVCKKLNTVYTKSPFSHPRIKGIILDTRKINLDEYKNLKVISRVGVGLDNIDLEECNRRGIKVYNTPCDELTNSVAEFTVMQILNFLRKNNDVLFNKTVGIIGKGRIGGRVFDIFYDAKMVRNLYYHDIKDIDKFILYHCSKETILESDIICIHISGSEEVIGEKEIKQMKQKPIIVNMARAGCVNIKVIYEALEENKINGFISDVDGNFLFYKMGLNTFLPCMDIKEKFLFTPHIASDTIVARTAMENLALENLIKGLKE